MLLRAVSLLVVSAALTARAAEPPSTRPLAIVHGTVLDGLGGAPLADGVVLVRAGRIEAVGPAASVAVPKDAEVIDARGKTVLPGLAGLSPLQAIRLATHDAARVLQAEGEWGSLKPGLKADVLVVAGRPHERISDTRKIDHVVKDGRVLDRAGLRFDARRDGGHRAVPGLFFP